MDIEELNLDKTTYVQLKRAGVNTAEELETDGKRIKLLAPGAYRRAVAKYNELAAKVGKNQEETPCQ